MFDGEISVAVVGAGPTGLTLADALARSGVSTSILDASPGPEWESSRATTIHARTLEALNLLDGLGDELAGAARWASKSHVWADDRRIATVHWDRMPTRYAATVNLPQADLEETLRRRLDSVGVLVQWDRRITNPEEVDAFYVVGCDGAHSAMRESMGVDLAGATFDERFLLGDVKLSGAVDEESTSIWVSTAGVLGILPLPNKVYRLNGTLTDDEVLSHETLPETMSRRMGAAQRRIHVDEVLWAAEYRTQFPTGQFISAGQRVPRRRLRPSQQPGRRARHERGDW